jgi:UDP-3-O-[3-hydroxymyristoyl] glucosamine N-acyltransferase
MTASLGDLAVRFGCELKGDPDTLIVTVGTLQSAGAGAISFLANPAYKKYLGETTASAVIVMPEQASDCPVACLIAADPYLTYARIAALLYPDDELQPGVHAAATIAEGVHIPATCEIAAGAVIGNNVEFGEHVYVGPNCVVNDNVKVGSHTRLVANITVYKSVVIGQRCLIHAGTVIGSDGFGIAKHEQAWVKVPQVGTVVIGDDVELGANVCIDRGAIDDTVLGNGVKLDNHVHIAHNVIIGDHTAIAGQSGVAGSTRVGARCVIGGGSTVNGHIAIADDVYLMGHTQVSKSITKAGVYTNIIAAEEAGVWRRIAARIKRLDHMAKRLQKLEKKVNSNSNGSN